MFTPAMMLFFQLLEQNGGYGNYAQPKPSSALVPQNSKPAGQLNNIYNAGMMLNRIFFVYCPILTVSFNISGIFLMQPFLQYLTVSILIYFNIATKLLSLDFKKFPQIQKSW